MLKPCYSLIVGYCMHPCHGHDHALMPCDVPNATCNRHWHACVPENRAITCTSHNHHMPRVTRTFLQVTTVFYEELRSGDVTPWLQLADFLGICANESHVRAQRDACTLRTNERATRTRSATHGPCMRDWPQHVLPMRTAALFHDLRTCLLTEQRCVVCGTGACRAARQLRAHSKGARLHGRA